MKPVALDVWNGLIFVHLGAEPPTLESFLGPVTDLLSGYQFAQMTLVQDQTVDIACNWKTVVDNFSELYHVDFLHPQHQRMVDCQTIWFGLSKEDIQALRCRVPPSIQNFRFQRNRQTFSPCS